jgi:hypothetical protein
MQCSSIENVEKIMFLFFMGGTVHRIYIFCLQHVVLQHKYPAEVDLDKTRELAMAMPTDTVGFVKYKTLHDYDMVSRLLYDTLWVRSGYCVPILFQRSRIQMLERRPTILTKDFREFPQFLQANSGIVAQIRPRPLVPYHSDPLFTTHPTIPCRRQFNHG